MRLAVVCVCLGACAAPPAPAPMLPPPPGPEPSPEPEAPRSVVVCAPPREGSCTVSGSGPRWVLRGVVLAPDAVLVGGEVVIEDGRIAAVGCGVAGPGSGYTVDCPRTVISPGLINLHDHLFFNQKPPGRWGDERFDHRHQWRLGLDGHTQITDHQAGSEIQCTWSELRHVVAGTTSVVGTSGRPGLARNLDDGALLEGLDVPVVVESNQTIDLGIFIFRRFNDFH